MLETTFPRATATICLTIGRTFVVALGMILLQANPARAAAPQVRSMDIADYRSYLPADHPARQGMRKFADLVNAGSGGTLVVHVRDVALPGSPAKQIAALQTGDSAAPALMLVAATGLTAVGKEFGVLDLPFVVRDEKHADGLLDGAFGAALLQSLSATGLTGLAWWENGFRQMTTSGAPIVGIASLRGLRFRVIGEPVFVDAFRAMGANPVPLPFGELYQALKLKQVDAEDNFYSQILAGRLYEVQSSLTVTNHSYSALVLVANTQAWNGLTDAEQRLLKAAAIEAGQFERRLARDEARQARAKLTAHGMRIHDLAKPELADLVDATQPVRGNYFNHYPDRLRKLYFAESARLGE